MSRSRGVAVGEQHAVGSRWTGPRAFVCVTVAYLVFAQLVVLLNDPVAAGAGLWPAAGVTLGALLLLPFRAWGWVVAAVVVAELGGDLAHGYGWAAGLGWTLGNVVEPVVGAWLLRRVVDSRAVLTTVRNLLLFVAFGVVAGPLVGASIGAITSVLAFDMSLTEVWPKYFVGDALGVIVVAPVVLSLRLRSRSGATRAEAGALVVVSLVVCAAVFVDWAGAWMATMPYLLMPCLTWAAFRFGVRGVSWLALAMTMVGNLATAYGDGPFARAGGPTGHSITMLQVFLGVSVTCALLAAVLADNLMEGRQVEARWRHQATHDPLTGLANRAVLDVLLHDVPAADGAQELSLVMCDVDGLKGVNDTWGHAAGDELLRAVARRIRHSVRPDDVVARVSGDEFVLVLRGADVHVAGEVADRVLSTVRAPVQLPGGEVVVPSVSMGVANQRHGETPERLIARADRSMYRAKALGGGRVEPAVAGAQGQG